MNPSLQWSALPDLGHCGKGTVATYGQLVIQWLRFTAEHPTGPSWRPSITILVILLFLHRLSPESHGACTCENAGTSSYYLTYNWQEIPGTIITAETYEVLAESIFSTGSCPYAGATPPSKTCRANGGTGTTSAWSITGSISAKLWGVSSERGGSVDYNAECSAVGQLNFWCHCCHMQAGLLYMTTTKQMRCIAPPGDAKPISCGNVISGSNKVYAGSPCREAPCTPPDPCTTICPPAPRI